MLNVIGGAPGTVAKRDYYQAWRESPEFQTVKEELQRMREKSLGILMHDPSDKNAYREYAAPFSTQLYYVTHRFYQQLYRTPSYILSKLFLVDGSYLIGFSFFRASNTIQGLQNQMYSIFIGLTIFGNFVQQIMSHFVTQRSLYEVRERPSKAYSWQVFMLSNILGEFPVCCA